MLNIFRSTYCRSVGPSLVLKKGNKTRKSVWNMTRAYVFLPFSGYSNLDLESFYNWRIFPNTRKIFFMYLPQNHFVLPHINNRYINSNIFAISTKIKRWSQVLRMVPVCFPLLKNGITFRNFFISCIAFRWMIHHMWCCDNLWKYKNLTRTI